MNRDYDVHITNYILQFFRHHMTDVEQAADEAVVFTSVHDEGEEVHITFRSGTPEDVVAKAKAALEEGSQVLRRKARERIVSEHRMEVFANACPKCGKLPATPKAKMCIWCSHSWREEAKG
jgi:hypothetical protein